MAATVTVTLPAGTRITCSQETAKKLGLKESEPKATAKKAAAKKS